MREHHSNVINPISVNSIGKGYKKFSKDDIAIINHIAGKTLKDCGYNIIG